MKKKARYLRLIVGFVFLATALALWRWPQKQQPLHPPPFRQQVTTVEVAAVEEITSRRTVRLSGVTRAEQRAVMAFSIPGRLVDKSVEAGSQVEKGDELARIDIREYQNKVTMTRATVAELNVRAIQAKRDKRRIEKLADVRAATAEELEQVTAAADAVHAALLVAHARLDEAERVLKEATLKAPFAGTVTAVFLEPGEYAFPGQPVVELSGHGNIELQVEVPENIVMALTEGQKLQVTLPMTDGKQVAGQVTSVSRAAATAGRLFPVVITLEPLPDLVAGMTAEVLFEVERKGELTIPVTAVLNPGSSSPYVFCLNGETVRRVPIAVKSFSGKRVVIQGDLSTNERIVVSGHTMLTDGEKVKEAL